MGNWKNLAGDGLPPNDEDPHVMSALNAGVQRAANEAAWLLPDDMRALQRFCETCEDAQPWDVPKDRMRRLAELGVDGNAPIWEECDCFIPAREQP